MGDRDKRSSAARRSRSLRGRTAVRALSFVALAGAVVLGGPRRVEGGGSPLAIDEPADGVVVPGTFRVAGRVAELGQGRQAVLRVNGQDVEFQDGRFSTTIEATDGPLRVRAVFAELGDPAQAVERSVIVDATPPVIEFELPIAETGDFPGDEGVVRGVARDAHLARVRMNDKVVTVDGDGGFEAVFLLPPKAPMEVVVEAIDVVGNVSTAKRVLRHADGPAVAPPAVPKSITTSPAVEDALRWLAAHQSTDGGWECAGFGRWCDGKPTQRPGPDGGGKASYDVGVTGLAVLAFVRAGYTDRSEGPFGKVVAGGLRYLRSVQDAEGCFGPRTSGHYPYNHAIAAAAVIEAFGATRSPSLFGPAGRGVAFVTLARNPTGAWRYGIQPGDSDTSVTGWMAAALAAARSVNAQDRKDGRPPSFGLDPAALPAAVRWVDAMTDPATGRVGYQQQGTGPARPSEMLARFPSDQSEAMTAAGLLIRMLADEDPKARVLIERGAALCAKLPPTWDPDRGSIDLYYWYHATRALSLVGGSPWSTWYPRLKDALVPHQRADGPHCTFKGSWDPIDPWGPDGGRVYATAISALTLIAAELAPPAAVAPGPKGSAPTAPDAKARLRSLRDRASKWANLRQVCVDHCQQCDGRGSVRGGRCPRCLGLGKTFNARLRDAYLLMRSPAWRARPQADAEFQAFYKRVWQRQEASPVLRHYHFGEFELVDDTHGVVAVFENGAALPTPSRWVWAEEPAFPKGTWFLWTEASDGTWP